jgi:hypothetical protein
MNNAKISWFSAISMFEALQAPMQKKNLMDKAQCL